VLYEIRPKFAQIKPTISLITLQEKNKKIKEDLFIIQGSCGEVFSSIGAIFDADSEMT
jgi:hypothetical protein